MPLWFVSSGLLELGAFVWDRVDMMRHDALRVATQLFLLVLYWVLLIFWSFIGIPGGIGAQLSFVVNGMVQWLVRQDVRLANFITSAGTLSMATQNMTDLTPQECAKQFNMCSQRLDEVEIRLTQKRTIAILYFAIPKVLVGVLSAAVITLAVIQPVILAWEDGRDAFIDPWITYRSHPCGYVVVVVSLWTAGAVGLPVIALLSVKLTHYVCDEGKSQL